MYGSTQTSSRNREPQIQGGVAGDSSGQIDSDIQTEPTQIEEMKAAADATEIVEIIAEAELALDLYAPQSKIQRAIEMKVAN